MPRPTLTVEEAKQILIDCSTDEQADDMRLLALAGARRDFMLLRELRQAIGKDTADVEARLARVEALLPAQALGVLRRP